ncbi:MAG: chemotaxis protein CheB [Candidatus Omnitrophota bacterium]|nr:chemotaxis protein CheB [Candidatus Omnitrophota bacterium]
MRAKVQAIKMIVIGASKGGGSALKTLLSALPRDFPLPVAIVQHRGPETGSLLRDMLQAGCLQPVVEVEDKELILGGRVYLAPASYHLLVDNGCFSLSTEAPVSYARPSVDVLFESAADACGAGLMAVVLTGANQDGAAGTVAVKRRGGLVVVQEPSTAEHPTMPRAAIAAWGHVSGDTIRNSTNSGHVPDRSCPLQILPLEEIGPFIVREAKKSADDHFHTTPVLPEVLAGHPEEAGMTQEEKHTHKK